ncbi:acid protease [Dichomitus squalens]|uniref:Acid protease n=1 Tax=Dichomitus squalens TaxID=114155 RepID=A0A4V2JYU5_9APHY|nr:acid protease [Dichomitus squalens]
MLRSPLLVVLCAAAAGLPTCACKPIVADGSPLTLPFMRRLNISGIPSLLQHDQARARALVAASNSRPTRGKRALPQVFSASITDQVVDYIANVGIGVPPTFYNLIVDTGSANIWVGAGKAYDRTSSSQPTGQSVSVQYGSGDLSGEEFIDTVTIGSMVVPNVSIGSASTSQGFEGVDGVLGLGPRDLNVGTLSPDPSSSGVPTLLDQAFREGIIPEEILGVFFAPTTSADNDPNAELTFGGIDSNKTTGPVSFVPITTTSPSSEFIGFEQSITYGSIASTASVILSATAGITDTGTTLLLIATDALMRYKAVTGAVLDNTTGLLKLTPAGFSNLKSLFFNIGGTTYEFTPNAQIWPRSARLNTVIGGDPNSVYLIVSDIGTGSGEGLDFINGMVFLQRFYSVFDVTNNRVGFATTQFTDAVSN